MAQIARSVIRGLALVPAFAAFVLPQANPATERAGLDGGRWKGRRILSAEWARRAASPIHELRGRGYGYLWWIDERPYRGRMIKSYMAGGNGGQIAMAVPELDLVPEWILPAVVEGQ